MPRHIVNDLRFKRGKPVAHDERGWPIFGYNQEGKPVCFAKAKAGERCMCKIRFANGRCRMHGGSRSAKNIMASGSFRAKLYAGKLPTSLGKILTDAVEDPEQLSLSEELAINTLQITKLLGAIGNSKDGADQATWKNVQKLAKELEELLFDEGVQSIFALGGQGHKVGKLANLAEKLVLTIKAGADESKLFREINEATEYRRRLIETDLKKQQMSRTMIPATEAIQLFRNIVGAVKAVFYKDKEGMRQFMQKLQACSLDLVVSRQENANGIEISEETIVDPTTLVGHNLNSLAIESNLGQTPIEIIQEYDGEGIIEQPYPCEKLSENHRANPPKKPNTPILRREQLMKENPGLKGFVQNDRKIPKKLKFK